MILELLNSNNECNHSLSNERLWCDYGVINSRRAGPGTAHSPPRPGLSPCLAMRKRRLSFVFASFAAKLKHEHTKPYNMTNI